LTFPGRENNPATYQYLLLAWQFLHGGLKNRSMKGIRREVSIRAVFGPDTTRALDMGQMPHASQ
jgi:hypothetical protein